MYDFELDALPLEESLLEESMQDVEACVRRSLDIIENTLDWYDHVACAFLLYNDPNEALDKITILLECYNNKSDSWHQMVLTPLFETTSKPPDRDMGKKLAESLHVIKHYRLLNELRIQVNSESHLDPLRLEIFKIIDSMNKDQMTQWITENINSFGCPTNDASWYPEMYCLKWIAEGKMRKKKVSSVTQPKIKDDVRPVNKDMRVDIVRGLCIIINQMRFDLVPECAEEASKKELQYRFGSDIDRDKLKETFRMLGHDVRIFENLRKKQLLNTLQEISQSDDLKTYDGLVVCILSHGERGVIFTSDSIPIFVEDIKSFFCASALRPWLADMPKLFFVQACQGDRPQDPVFYKDIEHDGAQAFRPSLSNFFEAWASVPGFASYRSTSMGAVFVRALCDVLQTSGHREDLSTLMTQVNSRVSKWSTPTFKIQMPCYTSSLTRSVYFKRDPVKFMEAILDQWERDVVEKSVWNAAVRLGQATRNT